MMSQAAKEPQQDGIQKIQKKIQKKKKIKKKKKKKRRKKNSKKKQNISKKAERMYIIIE